MSVPYVVIGDDVEIPVTLYKNSATFTISPAHTVKAAIITRSMSAALVAAVEQSDSAPGADWANSKVTVEIPAASNTGYTTTGPAYIEIQVDDGSKKQTWHQEITIRKGNIA